MLITLPLHVDLPLVVPLTAFLVFNLLATEDYPLEVPTSTRFLSNRGVGIVATPSASPVIKRLRWITGALALATPAAEPISGRSRCIVAPVTATPLLLATTARFAFRIALTALVPTDATVIWRLRPMKPEVVAIPWIVTGGTVLERIRIWASAIATPVALAYRALLAIICPDVVDTLADATTSDLLLVGCPFSAATPLDVPVSRRLTEGCPASVAAPAERPTITRRTVS